MSDTQFVRLWMSDITINDMARKIGTSAPTIYARANKLRKLGVKLPNRTHVTVRPEVNVEKLNSIIEQMS